MICFRCPKCESQMEVDESFAGRPARCPTCGCDLKVPKQGESPTPVAPAAATRREGATMVKIGGEQVEVVPPLETMVLVSMALVCLSVVAVLVVGLGRFVTLPWTVGTALGAALALLGVMIGVPAYHNARRSRGRRRGRTHAMISMLVGTGLFLVFLIGAIAGFAHNVWLRPTCEENLDRIYFALRDYAKKHDGAFPDSLEVLADEGYLDSRSWLTCPAYRFQIGTLTYVFAPDINVNNPLWPPDQMVVSDGAPYNAHADGYVRVLLLNAEVKKVPLAEWSVYQAAQAKCWHDILNQIRKAKEEADEKDEAPGDAPASGKGDAREATP